MFNQQHILYMLVAAFIMAILLVLAAVFVKNAKYKRLILILSAVSTVALHFSPLYVDFFSTFSAQVASPMILPIYPCNIMMWLLLICSVIKLQPNNKTVNAIYEFTFWAGTFCGIMGILFNENFASNPNLADWDILHGMLSHSTMLFGCLYLLVGKFVKIRVGNCLSVFLGLCLFLVDGSIINALYSKYSLGECNSMYLQSPPLAAAPWFNVYLIGILGLLLVFAITSTYEHFTKNKADRWYNQIGKGFYN